MKVLNPWKFQINPYRQTWSLYRGRHLVKLHHRATLTRALTSHNRVTPPSRPKAPTALKLRAQIVRSFKVLHGNFSSSLWLGSSIVGRSRVQHRLFGRLRSASVRSFIERILGHQNAVDAAPCVFRNKFSKQFVAQIQEHEQDLASGINQLV